jgi:hypothetical protein
MKPDALTSESKARRAVLWFVAAVLGAWTTSTVGYAGYWIVGRTVGSEATDSYEQLELYWRLLVWVVHPIAAASGGCIVGFSSRRLGGSVWAALVAPGTFYAISANPSAMDGNVYVMISQFSLLAAVAVAGWLICKPSLPSRYIGAPHTHGREDNQDSRRS